MTKTRIVLIALLVLNCMVLAGQIWPAGAPPFARTVNVLFLAGNLLYLIVALRARAVKSG